MEFGLEWGSDWVRREKSPTKVKHRENLKRNAKKIWMNEQYFPVGQNGRSGHNAKLNMNIGKFLFCLGFEPARIQVIHQALTAGLSLHRMLP